MRAITFFDDGTGSALYVAGTFTTAGGVTVNRVAKWNGTSWSALGSGFTITSGTAAVNALVVFNDGTGAKLYAGGNFNRSGSTTINHMAKWTGTAWTQVGGGLASQVNALAVFNSQLFAGGSFTTVGATNFNRLARWSGTSWVTVSSGANGTIKALASHNDGTSTALYAGGTFTQVGGSVSAARIAKWSGSAWSALGSGVSGGTTIQVNALASGQLTGTPALYVGGRFTTAGSVTANHVAAWQGTTWKTLGGGLGVEVNALSTYDDGVGPRLYAAGSFTTVGGTAFNRLARFTGTRWDRIGTGLNGNALALGAGTVGSTPGLFVGGAFTTASGQAASRLAKIVRPPSCADTSPPTVVWVQPRNGGTVSTSTPLLRLGAFDVGSSRLDTASLTLLKGGQPLAAFCNWSAAGDFVDCTPASLGGGSVTLVARIRDLAGNQSPDRSITFTVADSTPPTIAFLEPAEGAALADARPPLRLAYSDAGSGVDTSTLAITRDGSPLELECQAGASEAVCVPVSALPNGPIALAATIRDLQGNTSAPATRTFSVNASAPAVTQVHGTVVFADGSPAANAWVSLEDYPGSIVTSAADGTFTIVDVAVSTSSRLQLSARASVGPTTYLGFVSGIVPVLGSTTEVGQVVLVAQCDNFFTPLPLVGGGADLGGTAARLAVFDEGSGPRVFAAGDFNYGSTGTLPRIGRWGTSGWEWKGLGLHHDVQPTVNALAVFDDGTGPALYVGGLFTSAGGLSSSYLAKWNGKGWQEVGRGTNGRVTGLAVFDDGSGAALYVSGDFTRVQTRKSWTGADVSLAANHVAKWDGTSWSQVAGGQAFSGFNMTFDLAVLRDAAGEALYLWERQGPGIWKLSGGTWQAIGFSIDNAETLTSLVSATVGGTPALYAAGAGIGVKKRVGDSWVEIFPTDWLFYSLAGYSDTSGSFLYASGPFDSLPGAIAGDELRRWNGTTWSSPLAPGGELSVLTGFEAQPVLVRAAPFSKWQGGAWVPYPVTIDVEGSVSSVALTSEPDEAVLFAGPTRVGALTLNGGIARWDGTTVTAAGGGLVGGGSKVVQSFDGRSWHVYGLAEASGQIAEWNGSGWSPLGSALGVAIKDVGWVDLGDGPRLYAAGNGVYRWNGAFWYGLGGPTNAFTLEGLGSDLYVGGAFITVGGVSARNLARWNGSQWSGVGTTSPNGVDGPVYTLLAKGGLLYVGGSFTYTGTATSANRHESIAAWSGSSWLSFSDAPRCGVFRNRFLSTSTSQSPIHGLVYSLATFNDGTGERLRIGGDYASECSSVSGDTLTGNVPGYLNVNLGNVGVDGPAVRALATGRWNGAPAIAVGGDFGAAGGVPAGRLAIWHASPSWGSCAPAGQPPKITVTAPVGFTNLTTVTITGNLDEPATLTRDGIPVPVAADLTFAVPGVPLREGVNSFLFEAVDRAGVRGTLDHRVVLDTVPPTLAFTAPAPGQTVFGSSATLDLALADASSGIDPTSLALTLNGTAVPGAACAVREAVARCAVTAQSGANLATATIRDRAGNSSAPAQLSFNDNTAAGNSTQLVGNVVRTDGSSAGGARVRILGRPGAETTTLADGTFSLLVAGIGSDAPWTVVAELTVGGASLLGFKSGIVPVPGGSTPAGTITLRPACDPEFARDLFGLVGVEGRVRALVVYDDGSGAALYVGGSSLRYAGNAWHHLLRWDGEQLTTLPSGPDGKVNALAVFDEGSGPKLFVGGRFTNAGVVTAKGLARWDGQAWSEVGGGVDGCEGPAVETLAVHDLGGGPRLYVGGDIASVGAGMSTDLVAAWNGQSWTTFAPAPSCPGLFSQERTVFALARYDDGGGPALYAAGSFTSLGGVSANAIAKWTGSTWAPLGFGVGRLDPTGTPLPTVVAALVVFDGGSGPELYAGGFFNRAGNSTADARSIARWNGSRWALVGEGLDTYAITDDFGTYVRPTGVQALTVYDDGTGPALYATGSTSGGSPFASIARWNGTRWSPVGGGLGDAGTGGMAMTAHAGELYVAGGFATAGGRGANGIARWSGGAWRPLGIGFDRPVRALAVHDDGTGPALYAGGEFTSFGEVTLDHVARLVGTAWAPLGTGTDGTVTALESFTDGAGSFLHAGGSFTTAGGVAASRIARWRGDRWEALGSGLDGAAVVNALAAHDDGSGPALYVGGRIVQAGGVTVSNLARWRQGAWSAAGSFNNEVKALLSATLAGSPGLFAGGLFTSVDGSSLRDAARWNGSNWSALGGGPGNWVAALAPWQGGTLVAGLGFAGAFRLWDGTQWSEPPPGGSPNNPISALARWNDGGGDAIFVAGSFTQVPGKAASGIARWSGNAWSALGAGVTAGSVSALRGFEDASGAGLFVGGSFTAADGVPAYALAKWTRPLNCVDVTPPTVAITAPEAGPVKNRPQLVASYQDSYSGVDTASLQWTLDGSLIATTCSHLAGSSVCGPDLAFADGAHELRASVADLVGNRGNSSPLAISVDGTGPTVAFTSPIEGAVLTDGSARLSFTWSDSVSGVDLDGFDAFQTGTSSWSMGCNINVSGGTCVQQLPRGDGRWTARVSITDAAANLGEARVTFTVEANPPLLEILAPAEGAVTSDTTPEIRLRMSDAGTGVQYSSLVVTANGGQLTVSCQTFGDVTTCVPTAPLVEGAVSLTATVRDGYGRQSPLLTRSFTVRLDFTPPAITLTSPADGALTTAGEVTPTGSLSELAELTLDGVAVAVQPDLSFAHGPVPLDEGANPLLLVAIDAVGNRTDKTVTVRRDTTAPSLAFTVPTAGSSFDPVATPVQLSWSDQVAGVDLATFQLRLNGNIASASCEEVAGGATCQLTSAPDGPVTLAASIADLAGNVSATATVSFTSVVGGDFLAPVIEVSPRSGSHVRNASQVLRGRLSEPATLTLDGSPVSVNGDLSFTVASLTLAEGTNNFQLRAVDAAGNAATLDLLLILDTQAPSPLVDGLVAINEASPGRFTVSGASGAVPSAQPGTVVVVRNRAQQADVIFAVGASGDFSGSILGLPQDRVELAARDLAGNESAPLVRTLSGTLPVVPDPAAVAPALEPSVPASLCDQAGFLWSGAQPIQLAVSAGSIDCERVAVVRGLVTDRAGLPLAHVRVWVEDHPELGFTLSRADGVYDLAVVGGGPVTLLFGKDGYLPSRRTEQLGWVEWGSFDPVVLVALDTQVTAVDLTSAAAVQTARGGIISDESGTRQATILVPAGTTAEAVLPSGQRQPLTVLHVRATEYSVGPRGEDALPAPLPPDKAYTYTVELSVDEAGALGAERVEFDRALPFYVEDFLAIPVGERVPVAFFDRERRDWIASPDGRVVKVLAETSGQAELDLDGSGQPATAATLAELGITTAELIEVASLYSPGQRLWRVPIRHFTPWSIAWTYIFLDDAFGPPARPPKEGHARDQEKPIAGSFGGAIDLDNQILGQALDIAGAGVSLVYASDRMPGRKAPYLLEVPVTDAELPSGLVRVDVEVEVAGQKIAQTFPPTASRVYELTWDGRNRFGRAVPGRDSYSSAVTFVLPSFYGPPVPGEYGWSAGPGGLQFDSPTRTESRWTRKSRGTLGNVQALGTWGLGGWSLPMHHVLDIEQETIFFGDGRHRNLGDVTRQPGILTLIAGTGEPGSSGDGGPAKQVKLDYPRGVSVMRDGSVLVADQYNCRIRKIDPEGVITTIAGTTCDPNATTIGDDGPATSARLLYPYQAVEGPDGLVYIADAGHNRIRRILDGTIETFAGNGQVGCDGGALEKPVEIAFDKHGTLFAISLPRKLAREDCRAIYRIGRGGDVSKLIEREYNCVPGEFCYSFLRDPSGLAPAPDGGLYFTDSHMVARRPPGGSFSPTIASRWLVAGINRNYGANSDANHPSPYFDGDGELADFDQTRFLYPTALALGGDGTVYVADSMNLRVRAIGPDQIVRTVAGGGRSLVSSGDLNATDAALGVIRGVAIDPAGKNLYLADQTHNRVYRVGLPALKGDTELFAPAEDGSVLYVFDPKGHHLRTEDAVTRQPLWTFRYQDYPQQEGNAAKLLVEAEDAFGNVLTIERDGDGTAQAIRGPFGQRTSLQVGPNGYLRELSRSGGAGTERVTMTMDDQGLLRQLVTPKLGTYSYDYDAEGRLSQVDDPEQGQLQLLYEETTDGHKVSLRTAEGRTSSTEVRLLPLRIEQVVTTTDGKVTTIVRKRDGSVVQTGPDGTIQGTTKPEPRLGAGARILSGASFAAGGFSQATEHRRTAWPVPEEQDDPPPALQTQTDSLTLNGETTTATYTAASRTLSVTSPQGRSGETVFDSLGRISEVRQPGVLPVTVSYDGRGRLSEITQGSGGEERKSILTYDPGTGFLQAATDPLQRQTRYERDAVGRVTKTILPDLREVHLAYDLDGNLTGVTPPSRPVHAFDHNGISQIKEATAPAPATGEAAATTRYSYDRDHQLRTIRRPSGAILTLGYDPAGRVESVSAGTDTTSYQYDPATGKLVTITNAAGSTIGHTYAGPWLSQVSVSGPFSASVQLEPHQPQGSTFTNFRLGSLTINGQGSTTVGVEYDRDGLATKIGQLNLLRDAASGRLLGSQVLQIGERLSRNGFGELTRLEAGLGNASQINEALLDTSYERDKLGRIVRKTERSRAEPGAAQVTQVYDYSYEPLGGRLLSVKRDGTTIETYTYDPNGNRTSWTTGFGSGAATYDAQDRLLTYGPLTFTYTADGELRSKSQGGQTTTYTYDAFSNLRAVRLPDGIQIEYLVDGQNHRIGKKVNNTLVQRFLYAGGLSPIAELDAGGAVTTQYIYATGGSVPDYLVRSSGLYRIIADHLGSVRYVVDAATRAVAQRIEYDSFGRVTLDTNPGFQPFGFAGGLYDPQTKVVRFGARDYDPETGRWQSKDPIGFAGGDTNLYGYVVNDPVNGIDPSGLATRQDYEECNEIVSDTIGGMASDMMAGSLRATPPVAIPTLFLTSLIGRAACFAGNVSGLSDEEIVLGSAGFAAGRTAPGVRFGSTPPPLHRTFRPGPFARESIPASSPSQVFTPTERVPVNAMGDSYGCHTCGAPTPGTKSGNWIPDHQPPSALNPAELPQRLYPQCLACSREQGLAIARALKDGQI